MNVLKCIGWALLLLALAFPHAAGHVLVAATVVGTVLLGHFVATCVVAAVLLVASVPFRLWLRRRALRRFWKAVRG